MEVVNIVKNYDYFIPFDGMKLKIVRFTRAKTDGGVFAPEHIHKYYEFHYIRGGGGVINTENHEFEVRRGDLYLTKPFLRHSQFSHYEDPMDEYCIECDIVFDEPAGGTAQDSYEILKFREIAEKPRYYPVRDEAGILPLFDQIADVIKSGALGCRMLAKTKILQAVILTFQALAATVEVHYPKQRLDENHRRAVMIKNFVDVNVKNKIKVENVSRMFYLSPKQINRIMTEEFGCTFYAYLMRLRTNMALGYIRDSDMTLAEIAEEAGFSGYQQMYRAFMRIFGKAPMEFMEDPASRTVSVLPEGGRESLLETAKPHGEWRTIE